MKKIWFMLLLVCSACAFTACSDDNKKTPEPVAPTATMPEKINIGKEVTLEGKDFDATNAKLILKSETETVNPENVTFTATSVTFILPIDTKAGKYNVIVNQNDKDYTLGSVEVSPLKRITSIIYTEYGTTARYILTYNENKQINQIKVQFEGEDIDEPAIIFHIKYEQNQILISDEEEYENYTYTLDEGNKVTNSTNSDEIPFKWEYQDNYLAQITGTYPSEDEEGNEIFEEYSTEFKYTDGNLVEMGGGRLNFANSAYKNNPQGVDIVACIYKFFFSELYEYSDFFPHLLGICGNISTDLPTNSSGYPAFKYSTEEDYVKSISIENEDEVSTLSFEYEN